MYQVIKVVYDDNCRFILDIIEDLDPEVIEILTYNYNHYKERKEAIPIMTRNGTRNLPLVEFVDEEGETSKVIWSETNPDWKKEINKILKIKNTNNGNII